MLSTMLLPAQNSELANTPYYSYQPTTFAYMNKRNAKWKNALNGRYQAGSFENGFAMRGPENGFAAACLPGGPGSSLTSDYKEYFNHNNFRIIVSDWRGVGTSQPKGPFQSNNTPGLIDDIETMRQKLGAEKLMLRGGSWGASVAMAYAQAYPDNVSGLVLGLPFLASQADKEWNYSDNGIAAKYPQQYQEFCDAVGQQGTDNLLCAYNTKLQSRDIAEQKDAYIAWTKWEYARSGEVFDIPSHQINPTADTYLQRLNRMQIMADYTLNGFYLGTDGVLNAQSQLPDVPIIVVANDSDPLQRPDTLSIMKQAMPKAEFVIQENADFHWIFNPQNDRLGRSNDFVENAYAYSTEKIRRLYQGNDPALKLNF